MTAAGISTVEKALALYAERRSRDRLLGGYAALMGEPVWDMLLQLLIAEGDAEAVAACDQDAFAMGPPTAIHWICVLQRLGLVVRTSPGPDTGRAVTLSPAGLELMERVVTSMGRGDQRSS